MEEYSNHHLARANNYLAGYDIKQGFVILDNDKAMKKDGYIFNNFSELREFYNEFPNVKYVIESWNSEQDDKGGEKKWVEGYVILNDVLKIPRNYFYGEISMWDDALLSHQDGWKKYMRHYEERYNDGKVVMLGAPVDMSDFNDVSKKFTSRLIWRRYYIYLSWNSHQNIKVLKKDYECTIVVHHYEKYEVIGATDSFCPIKRRCGELKYYKYVCETY